MFTTKINVEVGESNCLWSTLTLVILGNESVLKMSCKMLGLLRIGLL